MEHTLLDPGFVENAPDGMSCLLACIQMVMRTRNGAHVLSFDEMNKILRRKDGEYSWEFALMTHLANNGFEALEISAFDIQKLCDTKEAYIFKYFGKEGGDDQITHSNMANVYEDAQAFLKNSKAKLELRIPDKGDVVKLLQAGYYLIPFINQRILQSDLGIAAHSVFLYGCSKRGVRCHNPGPPSTCASEIAWDLFMRAWSSPKEEARQLMAFRPC